MRIGDDSYATDQILSVSVTEPEEAHGILPWIYGFGSIAAYVIAGGMADSIIVGAIVAAIALITGIWIDHSYTKRRQRKQGFPRNVVLQVAKIGSRNVATGIPKAEAERIQREIEKIVADASASQIPTNKANNS